jgi:GntR family transcriptional regulator
MISQSAEEITSLDRQSPIPLHYQLKEMLRSWITSGKFDDGGQFPPERELLERLAVSRMTIRRALSELVNEGLLIREQGRGSFVVLHQVQEQLGQLTSFTEDMKLRGLSTTSKIIHSQLVRDEGVAAKMGIPTDEELVSVQRIRSVKGESIALQTAFVRHRFCPGLLDDGLIRGSLYKTLEERYALRLRRAVQTIEAKTADEYERDLLGIPLGRPVLWLERLTYLQNGQPIEYVRSTYRGDQYRFTVELQRHRPLNGGDERTPNQ